MGLPDWCVLMGCLMSVVGYDTLHLCASAVPSEKSSGLFRHESSKLGWTELPAFSKKSRRSRCAITVQESDVFNLLRLALSEKQMPQIVENIENG